jgi:hypothetical protein
MKHEEYFVESYEQIITGLKPARTHKKRRIAKKWLKRYGHKYVIETKKCKKIDVTLDLILEFCQKYGYPLPDEMLKGEEL